MNNSELKNKSIPAEVLEESKKKKKKKRKKSSSSNKTVKYIPNPWMYGSMFGLGIPAFPMMRPGAHMHPAPGMPGPHGPHGGPHGPKPGPNPMGGVTIMPSVDVKGAGPMCLNVTNAPEASMPAAPVAAAPVAAPAGGMGESLKESKKLTEGMSREYVEQTADILVGYDLEFQHKMDLDAIAKKLEELVGGSFDIEYETVEEEDDALLVSFYNEAEVEFYSEPATWEDPGDFSVEPGYGFTELDEVEDALLHNFTEYGFDIIEILEEDNCYLDNIDPADFDFEPDYEREFPYYGDRFESLEESARQINESVTVSRMHEVHQSGRVDLSYAPYYKYHINLDELEDELNHSYGGKFFIEYVTKDKEDDTLRISFTNDTVVETLASDDEVELQSDNFIDGQALIDDLCSSNYLRYEFDVIDHEFTNCNIEELDLDEKHNELFTGESLEEDLPRQR